MFHDQEPIHLDIHNPLFVEVARRTQDLTPREDWRDNLTPIGPRKRSLVTSEKDSEFVSQVCSRYKLEPFYYFFHGWAALDWYRGYNRSFLITDPVQRTITRSFISPNRIIGGKRQHRIELMYHLLKRNISNAWISFPETCPAELIHINDLAADFPQYADMHTVFAQANLPWNFPGEAGHPMHSCWLSLFDESAESLLYLVNETVATGRRYHLTEKTFKPICMQMPFVLVSTAGSLDYLRSYGFKTFDSIWDESYDLETDDGKRLVKIADLVKHLDSLSAVDKQDLFTRSIPIIQHNYNHFYNGAFESILWEELMTMLNSMAKYFND